MADLKRLSAPSIDNGANNKIYGSNWNDLYDTLKGAQANNLTFAGTLTLNGILTANAASAFNAAVGINNSTLTFTGATIAGAPTWSNGQTLPSLTVSGITTLNGATTFNNTVTFGAGYNIVAKSGASDPSTSDVAASQYVVWHNSTTGDNRLWYNDAGTVKMLTLPGPYYAYIFITGTKIYAVKQDGSVLASGVAGTDDLTVMNAAVTAANGHGAIFMKAGVYQPSATWDLSDKNVQVIGERNPIVSDSTGIGVTIKTNGRVLNIVNTAYVIQRFENIYFDGINQSDIVVNIYSCRERELFRNVTVKNGTIGVKMQKCWYQTNYDLRISACTSYGLYLQSPTSAEAINTVNFYGGYITSCPVLVYLDSTNQVNFFGTIIEGASTNAVQTANGANLNVFDGCSFESNTANGATAGWTVINEASGISNTYINCRFDSDVNYNICNVGGSSRDIRLLNNMIQANTTSLTATYVLSASSTNTLLVGNKAQNKTPITVSLSDSSGGSYYAFGNTSVIDKHVGGVTVGNNGLYLFEIDVNTLGLSQSFNQSNYRNFRANAILTSVVRSTGSTDVFNIDGTNGITMLRPISWGASVGIVNRSGSADPLTSDIPSNQWILWKNTASTNTRLWFNDAGTMKRITLPVSYDVYVGISGTQVYAIKNDGTTVSVGTAGTNDSTVLQAAINNLTSGGVVYIGAGSYSGINVTVGSSTQKIKLKGEGYGTQLNGTVTFSQTFDCSMEDIWINNSTLGNSALVLTGVKAITIQNCKIQSTSTTTAAVIIDGGTDFGYLNRFLNCIVTSNYTAISIQKSASAHVSNSVVIKNCLIEFNDIVRSGASIYGISRQNGGATNDSFLDNYIELYDTGIYSDEGNFTARGIYCDNLATGINVTANGVTTGNFEVQANHPGNTTVILQVGSTQYTGVRTQSYRKMDGSHFTGLVLEGRMDGNNQAITNVANIGIGVSSANEILEVGAATSGRFSLSDAGGANRYELLEIGPSSGALYSRLISRKIGTGATQLPLKLNDLGGSVLLGSDSALSTSATDGFVYIPTSAGTPTGTPTTQNSRAPIIYDTTNNAFYTYNSGWKQINKPSSAYNVSVVISGSNVYAIKADGTITYSGTAGTNDAAAINAAISALTGGRTNIETVRVTGSFTIESTISVPSYTRLDLSNAKLTSKNALDNYLITNSDSVGGNTRIEIIAGKLDGNQAGQVSGGADDNSKNLIHFNNVTDSIVRDAYITNANNHAVRFLTCTNCVAVNNKIDSSRKEGISINSGAKNVVAQNRLSSTGWSFITTLTSPDCIIVNNEGDTSGVGTSGITINGLRNIVKGNVLKNTSSDAIPIAQTNSSSYDATGSIVEGNTITTSGAAGISATGYACKGVVIKANVITGLTSATVEGIAIGGAQSGFLIDGNIIHDNAGSGIRILGATGSVTKYIDILNNICYNNGTGQNADSNTRAGIVVRSGNNAETQYINIANNICYDDQGTPTQQSGIRMLNSDNSTIRFNDVRNNSTIGLSLSGNTNTVIFGNNGYNNIILSDTGLTALRTFSFPDVTDTLVTLTATQSLTNKTLSGATLSSTIAGTPTISSSWTWSSSQTFPGITSTSSITIANASFLQLKDTGGTAQNVLDMTGSNNVLFKNPIAGQNITIQTDNNAGTSTSVSRLIINSGGTQGNSTIEISEPLTWDLAASTMSSTKSQIGVSGANASLIYNVPTSMTHTFRVNGVNTLQLTNNLATFAGTLSLPNNFYYGIQDNGNTNRPVLHCFTDNTVYLNNDAGGNLTLRTDTSTAGAGLASRIQITGGVAAGSGTISFSEPLTFDLAATSITSSKTQIGTNAVGGDLVYNVPSAKQHSFRVAGTTYFQVSASTINNVNAITMVLSGNNTVTDGGTTNSSLLTLRGTYDSDATTGVTSSNYDFKFRHTMTSATPAGQLDLINNAGTVVMSVKDNSSIILGSTAALSTSATDGFTYMPTCAGTPIGTPTSVTGKVAWVYDSTNNIIYVYNGGAWKKTAALT